MSTAPHYTRVSPGTSLEFEVAQGLSPFTWARRFRLMSTEEEWPFVWLRSLDDAALCLVAVPLSLLFPEQAARALRAPAAPAPGHGEQPPLVLGLVVVDPDPALITVNLLAPIVLDVTTAQAHQIVLDGPVDQVRTPLTPALSALATRP